MALALRDRADEGRERDLGWVDAFDQLCAWLRDMRPYHGQHANSWKAAIAEFEHAADGLPTGVRAALGAPLAELLVALERLPAQHADVRAGAVALAGELEAQAASGRLLDAAWADVVECVRSAATSTELAARVRTLRTLLRRSDRDAEGLFQAMVGVLYDQRSSIAGALGYLGEPGSPACDLDRVRGRAEPAGWPHHERADLCLRLLQAPPRAAHHIVWHAFDNARIEAMAQEFGSVTLYHRDWLHSCITEDGPHRNDLPAEISSPDAWFPADMLPEGKDVVLARVDLGVRARADAPADSRLHAISLITAASFPDVQHGWQMFDGYIHFGDGLRADEFFRRPDEDHAQRAPFGYLDATARRLSELAPRVAPLLPGAGPDLATVIDAIGWWKSTAVQPAHPAVVLDVRILEIISAATSETSWYRFLDDHYKDTWIKNQIADCLVTVAWRALDNRSQLDPETAERIEQVRRTLVVHRAGNGFQVDLPRVIASLPFLTSTYPDHTANRRRALTLARRLEHGSSMAQWHTTLEGSWSRALNRLRSVRNSIAHGGPHTPAAVAAAAPFAHSLAGCALLDSLASLLEGRQQGSEHEARRIQSAEWVALWLSGTSAVEAFAATPAQPR
ncbi:hypothetical protein TR51_19115 [Kitasatospora griseola]|uniref:Uncharacterized protein n=1 Tax=Kitasatospora griseola TaxID=2064 RepID=A0A0D0N7Z3_KITGR|nr:hypothetical protein TR51_19115 [Kitasatospora griseola]